LAEACSIAARRSLSLVNSRAGKVYLVGAGPGAPDLITLRGAEAVRLADVVIYDYLASPEILRLAPETSELIYAGKKGGGAHRFNQDEINRMLIEQARAGRRVIRLKGGDPFIFGRGGEEALALEEAGIDYEVIPGVTSAIAAPAFAGIPLTHRDYGSFVAFVTGHEDSDNASLGGIPWDELARAARARGTLVILMATARMRENLARLAVAGLSPDTPAAAVQWATTAEQKVVLATLATLADDAVSAEIGSPAIIVLGECAGLARKLRWAERQPLFGRRIVITRAASNASRLAARLRMLGAEAVELPTIQTEPPDDYAVLDSAIARLDAFDWIIFTSATGVDAFVARLRTTGNDIRGLAGVSIAAIGPATAARLTHHALRVAAMPSEYRAEALIGALGEERIAGTRILIPRAQAAREVLPRLLREKGAREVVIAPAYRTVAPRHGSGRIAELISSGGIDLVAFTSSSTVINFGKIAGERSRGLEAAVIGPITAATAREYGYEVVVSAAQYTIDGLIDAIVKYFERS
jgi:uroporphyrinogen III methyltransferase/synthase